MKNIITVEARRFPVLAIKEDNQEPYWMHVVLDKTQLQAAQLVGQSSKELIYRICARQGYRVLEIGKPEKKSIRLDLMAVWDGVRND